MFGREHDFRNIDVTMIPNSCFGSGFAVCKGLSCCFLACAMPRKKPGNHSKPCVPLEGKCTRSRDGLTKPSCPTKACEKCKEWRCKQHCACGRKGASVGWHAPRDAKKKVLKTNLKQKHPKSAIVAKPIAVAPAELPVVGRPCSLGLGVFSDNSWRKGASRKSKWHLASWLLAL